VWFFLSAGKPPNGRQVSNKINNLQGPRRLDLNAEGNCNNSLVAVKELLHEVQGNAA